MATVSKEQTNLTITLVPASGADKPDSVHVEIEREESQENLPTSDVSIPHQLFQFAQGLQDHTVAKNHDLEAIGSIMASVLFPSEECLSLLVTAADTADLVRIRLKCQAPNIAQIPWEYVYVDNFGPEANGFLALNSQFSITRIQAGKGQRFNARRPDGKPRVGAIISSPYGQPQFDAEELANNLESEFKDTEALELLPVSHRNTGKGLGTVLIDNPTILQFLAHGLFEKKPNRKELRKMYNLGLDNDDGSPFHYPATNVGMQMRENGVPMAIFLACDSASVAATDSASSAAQILAAYGVPVVIAMQAPISLGDAKTVSKNFYATLDDVSQFEASVRVARFEVMKSGSPYWGVPTIYYRGLDGDVFGQATDDYSFDQAKLFHNNRDDADQDRKLQDKFLPVWVLPFLVGLGIGIWGYFDDVVKAIWFGAATGALGGALIYTNRCYHRFLLRKFRFFSRRYQRTSKP